MTVAIQPVRIDREYVRATRTVLGIAGAMIALAGVALAIAGSMSPVGGGFLLFSGFGLIVSGALLAKRSPAGAWAYMIVVVTTVVWSLANLESDGSMLAYRLIGPVILIVLIGLLMPILGRWTRTRTVSVCAALIIATVTAGIVASNRAEATHRFPVPQSDGGLQ